MVLAEDVPKLLLNAELFSRSADRFIERHFPEFNLGLRIVRIPGVL